MNKIRAKRSAFHAATLLGLIVTLVACQDKKAAGPPILNGSWASSDGVYTAEFLNGSFSAVANDTGTLISQGEYIAISETQIQLKWNGLVSGTSNQADCMRQEDNQLNCVDVKGNKFSLRRNT